MGNSQLWATLTDIALCVEVLRAMRGKFFRALSAEEEASAARLIAERGDKSCAAIASRLAADIYGLDILAEDIEDEAHNTTRFVILAREQLWAAQGSGPPRHSFPADRVRLPGIRAASGGQPAVQRPLPFGQSAPAPPFKYFHTIVRISHF